MTLQSFNARLRKFHPYLRVRRRTGWVMSKAEGFAMVGVFHRYRSRPWTSTIAGDIPYSTRPAIYRLERTPGMTQPVKYMHLQKRRGRADMIYMLSREKVIKRPVRQLLTI